MNNHPSNIVLIGMPGSGKSTTGVILAKMLSLSFVDTDVLIQVSQNRTLQDIVDGDGYIALRNIEEEVILSMDCSDHVIASGGSAVYSHTAMTHLKSSGIIVFLKASISVLKERIHNYETRGIAKYPEQSFADLYGERRILYTKYADITIDCSELTHEQVCSKIIDALKNQS